MQVIKELEIENDGNRIAFRWIWCTGEEAVAKIYIQSAGVAPAPAQNYGEELCVVRKKPSYALAETEVSAAALRSGKYKVTLVPYIGNEPVTDGIVSCDSVYLGMPREIFYSIEPGVKKEQGMAVIRFDFDGKPIPGRQLCTVSVSTGIHFPFLSPIMPGDRFLTAADPEDLEIRAAVGDEEEYRIVRRG